MAVGRRAAAVRLGAEQAHEAGEVLGRICAEDPFWGWVVPDGAKRTRKAMARAGLALVRHGSRFGEVYATPRPLDGVAIWLPSEPGFAAVGGWVRTVMLGVEAGLAPGEVGRFVRAMGAMDRARRRAMGERHWHLLVVGVNPALRGQGIGGALLAPMLARADAAGARCATGSTRPRVVLFLRRHGFEVVGDEYVPGGGPRFWTLRREPGAAGWTGGAG